MHREKRGGHPSLTEFFSAPEIKTWASPDFLEKFLGFGGFWLVLQGGSSFRVAMETAEIYTASGRRASGSFRKNSSSIWRNSGAEVFSRSSRDEDDEEALKWAALEKLPTYNRLRKGLLIGSEGEASEVDIHNLGPQERKNLVERLVKIAEEDNEKFLLKLKNRMDRCDFSSFLALLASF